MMLDNNLRFFFILNFLLFSSSLILLVCDEMIIALTFFSFFIMIYRLSLIMSNKISFIYIWSTFIILFYFVGSGITILVSSIPEIQFQTLGSYYSIKKANIAIIYISSFINILDYIFLFIKIDREKLREKIFQFLENKTWIYISLVIAAIQLYFIINGSFAYMGYDRDNTSFLIVLFDYFAKPLLPLLIVYFFYYIKVDKKKIFLILLPLIVNFIWNMLYGRRILFFSIIVGILILYILANKKVNFIKILTYTVIGMMIFFIISVPFMALRMLTDMQDSTRGVLGSVSFYDLLMFYDQVDIEKLFESFSRNITYRLYYLGYLSEVLSAINLNNQTWGLQILNPIFLMVPFIQKEFSIFAAEALLHENLRWPFYDEGWTIIVGAISDFGLFGIFIYPFFMLLFTIIFLKFIQHSNGFIAVYALSSLLLSMITIECDPTFYTILIRNTALLYIVAYFVNLFNKKKKF